MVETFDAARLRQALDLRMPLNEPRTLKLITLIGYSRRRHSLPLFTFKRPRDYTR